MRSALDEGCVPLWMKNELESLIVLTQYNLSEGVSVRGTGTREAKSPNRPQ